MSVVWIMFYRDSGDEVGREEGSVRSGRVPRYSAYFWYAFKGAGVGGFDDELFAEGLEAVLGDRRHTGVFEGTEELWVIV